MSQDDSHPSYDELIWNYLKNEATPTEERQFRRLLGDELFRRRVAEYAIDLGHLTILAEQGIPTRVTTGRYRVRRRVVVVATAAAAILIAVGLVWMSAPMDGRHSTDSLSVRQSPSPISPTISRQAPSPIGQVEHVVGRVVRATSLDAADGAVIDGDAEIYSGDVLRTNGSNSFVVIQFVDETILAITEDSELRCTFDGERKRVFVTEGELLAQVTRQPEEEPMVFETPLAEVEVLGTKLSLLATVDVTELAVLDGEVRMHRRSDGQSFDVRNGETLVASANSDWAPQPLPPIRDAWAEDFNAGRPRNWRAGKLIRESLPPGSSGALLAERRAGRHGKEHGTSRIATKREWARGLFRVEPDTHLNFTYKVTSRGGFHVRLGVHADPWDPRTHRIYEFRNRSLRKTTPDEWRTVSVPLRRFLESQKKSTVTTSREPPAPGSLVNMVRFGAAAGRAPGLILDRIWVTQGAPESIEVLGKSD